MASLRCDKIEEAIWENTRIISYLVIYDLSYDHTNPGIFQTAYFFTPINLPSTRNQ